MHPIMHVINIILVELLLCEDISFFSLMDCCRSIENGNLYNYIIIMEIYMHMCKNSILKRQKVLGVTDCPVQF